MNLHDTITLRADEKAVKNSIIFSWVIIFAVASGSAVLVVQSLSNDEPVISGALSLFMVAFSLWLTRLLLSINSKQKRELRDDTILYQIKKDGIIIGDGNTYSWSDFKNIYYYKASVHLLEKGKILNAVIISPTSIDPKAFKQACLFIKEHAPPAITKSFNPR